MTEKVCCECGKSLNYRCVFYNGPTKEPSGTTGETALVFQQDATPMFPFMGPDESCHLECYIDRCVQKALERLAK